MLQQTVAGFEVRCCASQRLHEAIKRAAAFILVCRLLLPRALQAGATFLTRLETETAFRCFAMRLLMLMPSTSQA